MSMKPTMLRFLFLFLVLMPAVGVAQVLPAPEIEADAWALMEMNSGQVVASHNKDQHHAPASITKLMMNYVVFEQLAANNIRLQDKVSISEDAWRAEGSRMFADVNTQIELEHLLKSTIIQSGNDAAIALAEHVGGSETAFAALMNQAGKKIGLTSSHFTNSTGLPDEAHKMTAHDVLRLSAALIRDFPSYYEWYAIKDYTHNEIRQLNRNRLLWKDSSVDGLKTGFTEAAGYCLVGSAKRDGQRWLAVVLGSESVAAREKAVMSLLNYGFQNFEAVTLLDEQGGIASADVYGGEADEVRLQASTPVSIVVPRGRRADLVVDVRHSPYFEAPINLGQDVGVVSVRLDGSEVANEALVAMSEVKQAGWWKRLVDSIKLKFRSFSDD